MNTERAANIEMQCLAVQMDKELFQIALRVLQQINKRLPVAPEDEETVRRAAPGDLAGLALDQIAVELIQKQLRKRPD